MAGIAVNTQNALPAIEAELQLEVMNSSVVNGLSYSSDRFVATGNEGTKPNASTPNCIARKNLFENKWMIFTKPLQAGIQSVYGDAKAPAANNTEFASCNAGINTISFTVQEPGHNAAKAFRQVIQDPAGLARQVLQNESIPKINLEFFLGMTRGASDNLANDPFYANGSAIYGVTGLTNAMHAYNYATVDGATLSAIPQIPATVYDNGVAWNTAVNGALTTWSGATNAIPTFEIVAQLEDLASKRRIQPILGGNDGCSYTLLVSPEVARNILNTVPGTRTITDVDPSGIKLMTSIVFKLHNTKVVGTPWIDKVFMSNTAGVWDYSDPMYTGTNDVYGITPTTGYRPMIFMGADAALTGDDWTLRFSEDESVANPKREGVAKFLDIDTGFTRAEYRRPIANYRDSVGQPVLPLTYKNCLLNQNSIIAASQIA